MDEQVMARVLDEAERLFGQRGFQRVTLDEVAEAADASPEQLSARFADCGELLVHLAQARAHEVRSRLNRAVDGLSSRTMIEGAGFQEWFRWLAEHPYTNQIIWQTELVDAEVHRNWYRDLAADYARGLTRAIDEGELPRVDPEGLAWCLMGMADFLGMRYVMWTGRPELPEQAMRTFTRVLTRALQTGGGR